MTPQSFGSGSCFDALRAVLTHDTDAHKSKVADYLQSLRVRIRALDSVAPEPRTLYLSLLRTKTIADTDAANFPRATATHLRCCIVAIFREANKFPVRVHNTDSHP